MYDISEIICNIESCTYSFTVLKTEILISFSRKHDKKIIIKMCFLNINLMEINILL